MYFCQASIAGAAIRFGLDALGLSGGDAVALLLARVYALVNHRLQAARFVACGESVHVELSPMVTRTVCRFSFGFRDERLGASGRSEQAESGVVGVPENECLCLPFVTRAVSVTAVYWLRRQAFAVHGDRSPDSAYHG
jgi:hypothetical protein